VVVVNFALSIDDLAKLLSMQVGKTGPHKALVKCVSTVYLNEYICF